MRRSPLLLTLTLTALAWPAAADPPTKIMYFQPQAEMRLSIKIKRRDFPWPAMRVGVGESGQHLLGMVRFRVSPGVTRGEICRQAKETALIAFHILPRLVRLDVDASDHDDTKQAKAVPWFAASIARDSALATDPTLPPEAWLAHQGWITYSDKLQPDPKPAEVAAGAAYQFFQECLNRVPSVNRKHPPKAP